jgi:Fic family protein
MTHLKWNWQKGNWPYFSYNEEELERLEREFLKESGISIGVMRHLSEKDQGELTIELISNEAIETSDIEGEILDRASLQSSLLKEFQIGDSAIDGGKAREAGIAMLMKDLYTHFDSALSHESLCLWHDMLMNGRLDIEKGRYRSSGKPMQVVSGRIDKPTVHFEAPPYTKVPGEMEQFINWFNRSGPEGEHPVPPLIRAGIAHLYFVSIHPFEDGNGRIGRAIVEKSLSQNMGQPTLIALSSTINEKKKEYYAALELQNKNNQVTPWLSYFGKTIIEAQRRTIQQVEFTISKAKFFATYGKTINARQMRVVARIFKEGPKGFTGGLSAKNYISIARTTSSTATRDLKDLVEKGIFAKTGVLKHTRYSLNRV